MNDFYYEARRAVGSMYYLGLLRHNNHSLAVRLAPNPNESRKEYAVRYAETYPSTVYSMRRVVR